jgi:hypothetical protein
MLDGRRFVVRFAPRYPSPAYYDLILDWFDELQRVVPTDDRSTPA